MIGLQQLNSVWKVSFTVRTYPFRINQTRVAKMSICSSAFYMDLNRIYIQNIYFILYWLVLFLQLSSS